MMLQNSLHIIEDVEHTHNLSILCSSMDMLDLFDYSNVNYRIGIFVKNQSELYIIKSYIHNAIPILDINSISDIKFDILLSTDQYITKDAITHLNIKYIWSNISYTLPNYKITPLLNCLTGWQEKDKINSSIIIDNNNSNEQKIVFSKIIYNDKPSVYIIIPIYNQANFTVKCINSISKYAEEQYDIHIVLIDNGSDEKNQQKVNEAINQISNVKFHFINFDYPIGFIKATNAGISFALNENATYICLQNNDTVVTKNWMSLLITPINETTIGSGPTTNSPIAVQGIKNVRTNVLKDLPYNLENKASNIVAKALQTLYKDKIIPITFRNRPFTPAFFCAMFRADIFSYFLLDECFGNGYGDDVDYCFRIMQYNLNLCYVPAAYVLHNHRTTFSTILEKDEIAKQIDAKLRQCIIINSLNPTEQKKGVIYTAIIGNYDSLQPHQCYNLNDYDYICFTFRSNEKNIPYPWKVICIDGITKLFETKDYIKIARWIKLHPHMFLRNYKYSIWLDGNIQFLKDPNELLTQYNDYNIVMTSHPKRDCIYEEAKACIAMNKDNKDIINEEIDFIKSMYYPEHNGLVQSGIIIRQHNNKKCIQLMDEWWEMIKKYSCRDQLSFNYVLWKINNNVNAKFVPWDDINKNYIIWNRKHNK